MILRPLLAAAALALSAAQPARAAACWDSETTAAARVYEFEAMMMAVSMRCRAVGVDVEGAFERMVAANKAAFDGADHLLRAHFGGARSPDGHALFESWSTSLGNRYGGGVTSVDNCRLFDGVASELGQPGGTERVGLVASAMVRAPHLDAAACVGP